MNFTVIRGQVKLLLKVVSCQGRTTPTFFDEECDYRHVTACSARNWVYHPYFVLYSNLDQEIGPQL